MMEFHDMNILFGKPIWPYTLCGLKVHGQKLPHILIKLILAYMCFMVTITSFHAPMMVLDGLNMVKGDTPISYGLKKDFSAHEPCTLYETTMKSL